MGDTLGQLSPATTYAILNSGVMNSPDRDLILASLRNRDDIALRERVQAIPAAWALVGDVVRISSEYNARGYGTITVDNTVVAEGDAVPAYLEWINSPLVKLQNKAATYATDYWPWLAGGAILTIFLLRRRA